MSRPLVGLAVAAAVGAGWLIARAPAPAPPAGVAPPAAAPSTVAALPEPPALPDMPAIDREAARDVYLAATAAGSPEPGMRAFRSHTASFLDHNPELVEAHARDEGLAPAEVAELTNFALVTERMQRWPAVEVLVGARVPPSTRQLVAGLIRGDSEEMKLRLREDVAAGAPEPARAATIRAIEDHTLIEYFALTGMDRGKLDRLLADAVLGNTLEPEDGDADADEGAEAVADGTPLADGEVAEAVDQPEPQARIVVIDRVVAPTGAPLAAIEAEAAGNPRLAAELARDRR